MRRLTNAQLQVGLDCKIVEMYLEPTIEKVNDFRHAIAVLKIQGYKVDNYMEIARELGDYYDF